MSKLIKDYFWTKLSDIKVSENLTREQKYTRLQYLGFVGNMKLYESVNKHPGKFFAYIDNGMKYYRTSCGELVKNGNSITVITDHAKYTFDIIYPDYYD